MSDQSAHDHASCLCCEATEALGRFFRTMGPSENVAEHFRQSRVEFLKGIRAILDERIDRMSHSAAKGTRVVVE